MEILKFENAPAPRKSAPKKSNLKSLAGLATVAAVAVLGSTLAANISLGTGSAIEFGQGVQVTSACDGTINLAPKVNFVNDAVDPQFYLSTVSFTDVDGVACADKVLTLNAYGNSSATPLDIASSSNTAYATATVAIKSSPTTSTAVTVANAQNMTATTASFDLGFTNPQATSGAVYKLTLQSSN